MRSSLLTRLVRSSAPVISMSRSKASMSKEQQQQMAAKTASSLGAGAVSSQAKVEPAKISQKIPMTQIAHGMLDTTFQQQKKKKEVRRPMIPHRHDYDDMHCDLRRQWVEQFSNTKLPNIKGFWNEDIKTETLKGNIEMPIGMARVPLAVVGPLEFNGHHAKGLHLCPMATTEGALIASLNRGATCMSMAGGVETFAGQQQMIRAPLFVLRNAKEGHEFGVWLETLRERLQNEVICKHSRVAKLTRILPWYDQEAVVALFCYETADAAGQNATTACTWAAIKYILQLCKQQLPDVEVTKAYVECNSSGDKRASVFTGIMGRGTSVAARCVVPEEVLNKVMNVTSKQIQDFLKYVDRIMVRGKFEHNINIVNTLAAIFTATGQDIACVAECSSAVFTTEYRPDLRAMEFKLHIPTLTVGTVGGGTSLPTQRECLDIMGCAGSGNVKKFAEIVAGFCLSLEISTMCAVCTGEFTDSHNRLGRNRPDETSRL